MSVFLPGGGQDPFTYSSSTGLFLPETRNHTTLTRVTSSPIRYERALADGSVEVFTQSDGAVGVTRRVFMTQRIDPQGNALTFTYDASLRLMSVTDAIGQVTTLSYDLPQDQWKVTKVTDPFGRSALFTYDASGRLKTTTDTIGLTSSVTYNSSPIEYASSITTPYGTTRFLVGVDNTSTPDRSIEVIDPLGARERVELRRNDFNRSNTDTVVPVANAAFTNEFLQYRNTLYWNKRALAVAPNDPSAAQPIAAHLYHWLHRPGDITTMVSVLESEKRPLENRVWYAYPNQQSTVFEGSGREPSVVARVLDDGTTQASYAEHNALGHPTKLTDPLGRTTTLTYAANSLDLTQVKQTTAGINDVLMSATYNAHHQPLTITSDRFACGHPSSRSASTILSAAATSSGRRLAAMIR